MKIRLLSLFLFANALVGHAVEPAVAPGPFLRVAAVQLRSKPDVRANVARIKELLAECAADVTLPCVGLGCPHSSNG